MPANLVQQGALAAEQRLGDEGTPKLRLYATDEADDEAVQAYRQAVADGAVGVIGPLTRGAIQKLAQTGSLEVPVLALNALDDIARPVNLFALGLSVEAEARQMAALIYGEGYRQPLVLGPEGALQKRMREAFAVEWRARSGNLPAVVVTGNDRNALGRLPIQIGELKPDSVFLAANTNAARLLRPYLGGALPIFATSQAWSGLFGPVGSNVDLIGVRFVDMPWLLDPHHPEIAVFRRPDKPLLSDLQRFYALGIDAYRLALQLLVAAPGAIIELHGVTGILRLTDNGQFNRELQVASIGNPPATPAPGAAAKPAAPASPAVAPQASPATPSAASTQKTVPPPAPAQPAAKPLPAPVVPAPVR